MKTLSMIFCLLIVAACDPYGFGFKHNPAFVLDASLKAITNLDVESLLEATGKEALCIYGNDAGVAYLKEKIEFGSENIKLVPVVLSKTHFSAPKFVDYWSYYQERYEVEIEDKTSSKKLMKAIVDCEFGVDGQKSDEYLNLLPENYSRKECRVVKLLPQTFKALPVPEKCEGLKVTL